MSTTSANTAGSCSRAAPDDAGAVDERRRAAAASRRRPGPRRRRARRAPPPRRRRARRGCSTSAAVAPVTSTLAPCAANAAAMPAPMPLRAADDEDVAAGEEVGREGQGDVSFGSDVIESARSVDLTRSNGNEPQVAHGMSDSSEVASRGHRLRAWRGRGAASGSIDELRSPVQRQRHGSQGHRQPRPDRGRSVLARQSPPRRRRFPRQPDRRLRRRHQALRRRPAGGARRRRRDRGGDAQGSARHLLPRRGHAGRRQSRRIGRSVRRTRGGCRDHGQGDAATNLAGGPAVTSSRPARSQPSAPTMARSSCSSATTTPIR